MAVMILTDIEISCESLFQYPIPIHYIIQAPLLSAWLYILLYQSVALLTWSYHQIREFYMLYLLLLLAATGLNQAAAVNPSGHCTKKGKCQILSYCLLHCYIHHSCHFLAEWRIMLLSLCCWATIFWRWCKAKCYCIGRHSNLLPLK